MLKCFCEEPMTLEPNALEWCAASCGHMFHYLCLMHWLERSKTCPQCRQPVNRGQMFRLFPAPSDETPNNDNASDLAETLSRLEQMMELCQKKDGIIASLKGEAENHNNYRQENVALRSMLLTFTGDNFTDIFGDPNHFEEILKGKIALINEEESQDQTTEMNPLPQTDTSNMTQSDRNTETEDEVDIDAELEFLRHVDIDYARELLRRIQEGFEAMRSTSTTFE